MPSRRLIDPELLPVIELLSMMDINADSFHAIRAAMATGMVADAPVPLIEPVIHSAPGRDDAPDVAVYAYTPPGSPKLRPAILHLHGGGMVIGSAAMSLTSLPPLALALDAVAVSVDYRLAPETPFPGPQEDCYAALAWLVANAEMLGVDPARIVVMGESAGGGLAAALALMARDRDEYALHGQVLYYPMLDHRTGGSHCRWRNPMTGGFVWKPHNNQFGWESLRADYAVSDTRKGWFSPSLAESLSALPQSFIAVGALDLFLDEDLDYARRLSAAGVPVEMHVYPGAPHAFNMAQESNVARQAARDLLDALGRMLNG